MSTLSRAKEIATTLFVATALSACDGLTFRLPVDAEINDVSNEVTESDTEATPELMPEPDSTPDPVASVTSGLVGDWTTGCFAFDGVFSTQSELLTLSFDDNTEVFNSASFSDLNCTVPTISPETGAVVASTTVNSLEFPGESVTTSLGDASFINFTTESTTVDGVPVSEEFLGQRRFSIYSVSEDGRLFFGRSGNTPESRPTTLDVFFFFVRS